MLLRIGGICLQRYNIHRIAHNILYGIASTRLGNVSLECPLTDAPIAHRTHLPSTTSALTSHATRTPIGLAGDRTKILSSIRNGCQIDTYMMRSTIVIFIDAEARARVARPAVFLKECT
jgi:hypothetical protein